MASLCGPSNALTSLQKHTSVDRTLQQDRIRGLKSSQSQNFRSSPSIAGPSHAENEFEQFSGIPQDPRFLQQQLPGPGVSQQQPGLPVWAVEFQNLGFNAPQQHLPFHQPTPQPWMASVVPVASSSSSNWHSEFLKQSNKPASPITHHTTLRGSQSHSQLYTQSSAYTPQYNSSPYYQFHNSPQSIYQSSSVSQSTILQEQNQQQASDAAFELAFQEATNFQQLENQHDELDAISTHAVYEEETATEKAQSKDLGQDADELAKTAGQLLDSLSGNQNRKFQESTFLALMRNLRDKKVKVEGDKMVEVEAH